MTSVCNPSAAWRGYIARLRCIARLGHVLRYSWAVILLVGPPASAESAETSPAEPAGASVVRPFLESYCLDCHSGEDGEGGLAMDDLVTVAAGEKDIDTISRWERMVRRMRGREMPPPDALRPSESEYAAVLARVEGALRDVATEHPRPGHTETFRRLTRREYQNAIRDLLALEIDATEMLPADPSSHGFDNVTVGDLSPSLLDRYISAAEEISRLAIGAPYDQPGGATFRSPPDRTQENHVPGLPLGTRGGMLIPYTFPRDGQYEIKVRLTRDRNEEVEGLRGPHTMEFLIDRQPMATFELRRPENATEHTTVDANLSARVHVTAGPHDVGVTFIDKDSSLEETRRQPLESHFNMHRHPRLTPAVYQVSINGPFESTGPGETPSRQRIFTCRPGESGDAKECAEQILSTLLRRAYRRPIDDADMAVPMRFFERGSASAGFEAGIEAALRAILVNPNFLFRVERGPEHASSGEVYAISDVELASRLSFFLWSSIPDDELLDLAIDGELSDPKVLETQVRRMLADPKSYSLVDNFADQWLYLRNLDSITPDARLYPDFDDNLRQSMRRETSMLFEDIIRNDHSVLDLLSADYTYLNERLAKHYDIPHIHGSRFRRVEFEPSDHRGGLLAHASILTVTSYATRTSPVIRGNWVLENLIGTPPPPPPPNIPSLGDNTVNRGLSIRERLAAHRADAACAGCHNRMDPVGFALENYDAIGRWREVADGAAVDARGGLPDGQQVSGADQLQQALLERPQMFVGTLVEKLMIFGIGRGLEPFDGAAVREIVAGAAAEEYRFSAIVLGIVNSTPFRMRTQP